MSNAAHSNNDATSQSALLYGDNRSQESTAPPLLSLGSNHPLLQAMVPVDPTYRNNADVFISQGAASAGETRLYPMGHFNTANEQQQQQLHSLLAMQQPYGSTTSGINAVATAAANLYTNSFGATAGTQNMWNAPVAATTAAATAASSSSSQAPCLSSGNADSIVAQALLALPTSTMTPAPLPLPQQYDVGSLTASQILATLQRDVVRHQEQREIEKLLLQRLQSTGTGTTRQDALALSNDELIDQVRSTLLSTSSLGSGGELGLSNLLGAHSWNGNALPSAYTLQDPSASWLPSTLAPPSQLPAGRTESDCGLLLQSEYDAKLPSLPKRTLSQAVAHFPATLSHPEDGKVLSEHQKYLREQMEVFQATHVDINTPLRGRNKPVHLRQIGIRCRHCTHLPISHRALGSVYFPVSVLGFYQAAQNMCSTHLQCGKCSALSDDIKDEFKRLLAEKNVTSHGGRKYWAEQLSQWGLVDTDKGVFALCDVPLDAQLVPIGSSMSGTLKRETAKRNAASSSPSKASSRKKKSKPGV